MGPAPADGLQPGDHHANHLPEHIQQRFAAIPGVQRCVGLQAVVPPGRDDANADRRLLPRGRAQGEPYGDNLRANADFIGVSNGDGSEGLG